MELEKMTRSQVEAAITKTNARLGMKRIGEIQQNPSPAIGDPADVAHAKALYRRYYELVRTTRADDFYFQQRNCG